jgi:multidrug efflux pump subunit AcrB
MSGPVPITSLGTIVSTPNPSVIRRENGNRAITVSGSVIPGASVSQENKVLQNFLENLTVPDAYSWQTGGVNEENQSSVNSILKAMVVAALLILITMVIQLGSFRKATIVLLVIPLAISGVFMLFALTKTPLSFPALIGVLALYGIVVNNSMMVIEKINQNLRSGIEFTASIVDAAESRVEPIFLTSLITIMGLVPITLSDPLWRGLGGAIIAGLSVSGTIMLFFIPVVYHIWLKPDDAS